MSSADESSTGASTTQWPPEVLSVPTKTSRADKRRARGPSLRAAAPPNLNLGKSQNTLGVPAQITQDFPSPGSAPKGTRIFDANAVAEDKGVETTTGGWGPQDKLEKEEAANDQRGIEAEKEHDFVGSMKRAMSVKRTGTIRRALSVRKH
ncbi:hypothetical protein MBLNU459_g5555t1 [Dothideomycetes sp. NU459]